jgi:type VII secretion protein EccB
VQTRRDQLQAYRFAQTRMQYALLTGDTDLQDPPMRRSGLATFAGAMVAVLVASGFGVYGLLRPGDKGGWSDRGVLVVEKETGARYVYDGTDGALHPVLNYTSARLILGTPDVTVKQFSQASLKGVRRGAPRGLAGLPDALPAANDLVRGPWVVCSSATTDGRPAISVSIGTAPTGRRVTSESALLVKSPDNAVYLLWNDTRLLVTDPSGVLLALGLDGITPVPVSGTWLNSVAPGPDLEAPLPLSLGSTLPYQVRTQRVYLGQVFKVAMEGGISTGYYVALKDGLAKVTNVVALLLLGEPRLKVAYGMHAPHAYAVQPADVNAVPKAGRGLSVDGFPHDVPQLLTAADDDAGQPAAPTVCAAYTDPNGASMSSAVYLTTRAPGAATAATGASGPQARVSVPPGSACLARLLPHAGQGSDSVFLVTELGAKYAVPPGSVSNTIGYRNVTPVPVPEGILDLVPSGPALDPAKADADLPVAAPAPAGG